MTNMAPPALKGLYKPSAKVVQYFGICIYGVGGIGKTSILRTMPGKGLVIDVPQVEGGTFVLEDAAERIDVKPVETWDEIDDVYWNLARGNPNEYKWVAIDSITAFQELAKRKVITERDLDADPHTISLQEYGKMGQLIGELIYRFRKLPLHTIWIAQERRHGGGDNNGPSKVGPDIIPSALSALMPSMMLVGHMAPSFGFSGDMERLMRIQPHPDYYAKVRCKPGINMPAVVSELDLNVIIRGLLGTGPLPKAAGEDSIFMLAT